MTRTLFRTAAMTLLVAVAAQAADVAPVSDGTDREMEAWLGHLKTVSDKIVANTQSPDLFRLQLDQAEILMKLAARSKPDGRDNWLRMAIDSYATAVSQAPETQAQAHQWLAQVGTYIARTWPNSPVLSYIAYKAVYADHMRATLKGVDANKAQLQLCDQLMAFARSAPNAPEAPKAVVEVIESHEAAKRADAAKAACKYLAATYPKDPLAKRAKETLWRLGLEGEVIDLKLPLLYPNSPNAEELVDLRTFGGRTVVVYFWSSAAVAEDDLATLRSWADVRRRQGLEVVFVNVDETPAAARTYLDSKLTGGVHVHQKGGVDGDVTGRYGIRTLPETLVIGTDGALVARASSPSGVEATLTKLLGASPDANRRR